MKALIGLCLLLIGCSSSPTADSACADVAHARCTRLADCSVVAIQIRYGDEATCEAREKLNCTDAAAAPGTGNSPQRTEDCAQAIGGWGCTDFLDGASIPLACIQVTGAV